MRHGGQILVDQLKIQEVRRVFCVPGESYLAALDGLFESGIDTIVGRNEGGVSMMAEAHAKLTGEVGVAFVTRGPGATNASSGVHVAFQDSTPMILFVGQVASDQRDREAFQEVDYRAMFAPLAKWVAEIDRADRIPEYIKTRGTNGCAFGCSRRFGRSCRRKEPDDDCGWSKMVRGMCCVVGRFCRSDRFANWDILPQSGLYRQSPSQLCWRCWDWTKS